MFYKIEEKTGKYPFKLSVMKKSGFKFKKSFRSQEEAEWFIERYLCRCCVKCKQRGWVYLTRFPEAFRGSLKGNPKIWPPVESVSICPECQAKHLVQYEHGQRLFYGKLYPLKRIVLVPILE